jgi:hypothetical protein
MAAAATGVQVGAAMVATRFAVHDIGPASLAFLRYAIAVLCLVPPLLMSARVGLPRAIFWSSWLSASCNSAF